MKLGKIWTSVLVMLVIAALLVGCGGPAKPANQDKPVVLKWAHGQGVESVPNKVIVDIAKEVKEKSNGKIEIQVYPANQLGNERELAEALRMGSIDIAYISVGVMENFEPKLSLFSLPFIFKSQEHADKIVNGPIGQSIYENLLKQKGIRVFGNWRQNFRFVYSNKPINTAADFQGLKIRVPESPTFLGTFKALGANTTPLPWGEVYTSMQTNLVDAFEVPTWSVAMDKLYEVSKYVAKTRHILASNLVMINDKKWQSLSPEQQKLLGEAMAKALKNNYDAMSSTEDKDLKLFAEKGLKIVEFSEAEKQKMVTAVQPLWKETAQKNNAQELLDQIIKAGQ